MSKLGIAFGIIRSQLGEQTGNLVPKVFYCFGMTFPHFLDTVIESIVQWLKLAFVQTIPWLDAMGTTINNVITTMSNLLLIFFLGQMFFENYLNGI